MSHVPQSDQMRVSGTGRRKVALPPGRSQLDWVRNSAKFQRMRPRAIDMSELRRHRTREDAWMAINGKVFDVTPYIEYHPGGVEMILSGAGKDATNLFNKYHIWVNPDFMLSNCYLGMLAGGDDDDSESEASEESVDKDEVGATGSSSVEKPVQVPKERSRDTSKNSLTNPSTLADGAERDGTSNATLDEDCEYTTAEQLEALRLAELAE